MLPLYNLYYLYLLIKYFIKMKLIFYYIKKYYNKYFFLKLSIIILYNLLLYSYPI